MSKITINRRNGQEFEILIDKEDYERVVLAGPWCVGMSGKIMYVVKTKRKGHADSRLHRFILELEEKNGKHVNHINGNGLDNRKENLEVVTNQQNIQARTRVNRNNSSGCPGVYLKGGKWEAKVKLDYVSHYGGIFPDKKEACKVARQLRQRLHGKFKSVLPCGHTKGNML